MTKAFVFDIDGVLIRGGRLLAGAKESLERLNKLRIPWILLTNGGGSLESARAEALSAKIGVPISERQILQSHTPFRDFAAKHERILVVGGKNDACRTVAEKYGFRDVVLPLDILKHQPTVTPYPSFTNTFVGAKRLVNPDKPFDGIFVFHDSRDATTDTQVIIDLLLSDNGRLGTRRAAHSTAPSVPIHYSNGDMQWAADYPVSRFGQGALIATVDALYHQLTGHSLDRTVIGKPTKLTYDYASRLLADFIGSKVPDEIFMIGDNQYSDIRGANDYGWESILLKTGVYRETDPLFTKPTFIRENVAEAVDTALKQ